VTSSPSIAAFRRGVWLYAYGMVRLLGPAIGSMAVSAGAETKIVGTSHADDFVIGE
jgi:hypothetical protein